jgi:DNA polymerase III epsilon subunit-like protein
MLNFYIVDTETNGLRAGYHEITQLSIIRCSDRHQLNKFIRAEFPNRTDPRALTATGRVMADILTGISKKEAIESCEAFVNEDEATPEHRCFIGHNVSFDRRFLQKLWLTEGKEFPAVCWLDTMQCAKLYMTLTLGLEKPKKGLQDALKNCGLKPRTGAHNAISDTQNTYILREHMIKQGFDFLPHIKRLPQTPSTPDKEEDELC